MILNTQGVPWYALFSGRIIMSKKEKEVKTNAMRMLDRAKVNYQVLTYECDEFHDGMQIADMQGQSYDESYKTIVTTGKSGAHYVFVLPVDKEIDLKKAAREVGEKSVEMVHVKDIFDLTGYIRGGCTPVGMKKQFPTVIYKDAADKDDIYVSGGKIGVQLKLDPQDLASVTKARFADIVMDQEPQKS